MTLRDKSAKKVRQGAILVFGLLLFWMMGVTMVDILGRRLLGVAIPGVVEMIEIAMTWLVFLGFAYAAFTGSTLTVDLIDSALSGRALRWVKVFAHLVTTITCAILCRFAVVEFLDKLDWGDRTVDMGIPLTAYWAAAVFGFAFSVLIALKDAVSEAFFFKSS